MSRLYTDFDCLGMKVRADRKFLEIAVSAIVRHVLEFVYGSKWAEVKAKWETSN